MPKQAININENKYSNLKGEIGIIIAKEFLREYFRKKKPQFLDIHNYPLELFRSKEKAIFQGTRLTYKLNIDKDFVKKMFYKEKEKDLMNFFDKQVMEYKPDLLLSLGGKMHIVEVKCSSSDKKKKKELHSYQRKALSKMAKTFPVMIVYISLSDLGISIQPFS